jgi:hypothetical protein
MALLKAGSEELVDVCPTVAHPDPSRAFRHGTQVLTGFEPQTRLALPVLTHFGVVAIFPLGDGLTCVVLLVCKS